MLLQKASIEFDVVADLELLPPPKFFEFFCQFSFRLDIEDPTLEAGLGRHPQTNQ